MIEEWSPTFVHLTVEPTVTSMFSTHWKSVSSVTGQQVYICALSAMLWAIRWWMSSCRTGRCLVCVILPSETLQVTGSSLLCCRYYFVPLVNLLSFILQPVKGWPEVFIPFCFHQRMIPEPSCSNNWKSSPSFQASLFVERLYHWFFGLFLPFVLIVPLPFLVFIPIHF